MDHPVPTHLIGTPAFFPTLLHHIRTAAPNPALLPLHKLLFQSILLCLVAGNKHLILTTPEDDIGLVVKLAVWTLQSLFSLRTSKLKIRPREPSSQVSLNTDTFLRSLLFPSSIGGGESSQDESRHGHGHTREPSWGSSSKRKKRAKSKSKSRSNLRREDDDPHSHHRVPSSPRVLPAVGLGLGTASAPDALEHSHRPPHQHAETDHGYPFPLPPTPESPKARHAHTDPFPMPRRFSKKSQGKQREEDEVPQALVISGLENASLSSQRALIEEGEVGEVKLPDVFLLVYVCRWDPRERAGIEKTLVGVLIFLKKSTPIFISQAVRNAVQIMPFSSPTLGVPTNHLVHPKPNRAFSYTLSHSNPSSPSPTHAVLPPNRTPPPRPSSPRRVSHLHTRHSSLPALLPPNIIPQSFLALLRTAHEKAYVAPSLEVYLADLISAIRHWHELDGTLITVRARREAEDVARAWRVLGMDLTGMELVGGFSGEEDSVISDEDWEGEGDADLDVPGITIDMRSVSLRSSMHAREGDDVPVLSVTEGDIGRTIARVVSHRVRVREKEEETLASVLFGATFDGGISKTGERRTVKDILVQILGEV
ncbi:hypothetical protein BDQ17DRAFT_1346836 [Cyathus striatus]|nr:hypothetical protein BDQ17DRAFT_1346836 [Cyathus striatus]